MNPHSPFQTAGIAIIAKLAVDVIRAVSPGLKKRWVHLAVLVVVLIPAVIATAKDPSAYVTNLAQSAAAFLAAIGANEVTRKQV